MQRPYKKRIFKRLLILLAAVFLFASAFTIAGCSDKSSEDENWTDFF